MKPRVIDPGPRCTCGGPAMAQCPECADCWIARMDAQEMQPFEEGPDDDYWDAKIEACRDDALDVIARAS